MSVTALHNGAVSLDHAALLGGWRNTDDSAGGVQRIVLTGSPDGLRLRAFGAGRPAPHDWGETEACGYAPAPGRPAAWAFTATYDNGARRAHVWGYLKSGLLVLTTYHAFPGAGWPVPYWTREFFHRDPDAPPPSPAVPHPPGRADRATASLGPWQLDPRPLVGLWRNVDPAAARLSAVRITDRAGYLVLRPHGVWTPRRHDWHQTVGCVFADDIRTSVAGAFTAYFELAVGRVDMAGHLDRRLLTIETASTVDGRTPYLVQEHFYPS
ncbi:hypothetical protein WEI85_20940 [Actinomycetes bacterium KLBMP 9797]